jgi:hypothetical protein
MFYGKGRQAFGVQGGAGKRKAAEADFFGYKWVHGSQVRRRNQKPIGHMG